MRSPAVPAMSLVQFLLPLAAKTDSAFTCAQRKPCITRRRQQKTCARVRQLSAAFLKGRSLGTAPSTHPLDTLFFPAWTTPAAASISKALQRRRFGSRGASRLLGATTCKTATAGRSPACPGRPSQSHSAVCRWQRTAGGWLAGERRGTSSRGGAGRPPGAPPVGDAQSLLAAHLKRGGNGRLAAKPAPSTVPLHLRRKRLLSRP